MDTDRKYTSFDIQMFLTFKTTDKLSWRLDPEAFALL